MPVLKVLLIVDNLLGGGAQEIVYQLCKRLDQDAFEVSVLAFHEKGVYFGRINEIGRKVTVLVSSLNAFSFLSVVFQLFRLINKQKYDVVHTFLPGGLLLTAPIAWIKGVPLVHSVLSVRSQPPEWYYPLMKIYQSIVSAYVALEEDELKKQGVLESRIKLSEILLDLDDAFAVSLSRKEYKTEIETGCIVISVGRLHPDKGHKFAIYAWQDVINKYPNAKLWIVGAGPEENNLRNLIMKLNLQDSIKMLGYQKNLELIYGDADIFLRTSINEGPNLVTFWAMAAGLPIIAFHTPVPKEYINHNYTGWVVPVGEQNLSSAIIHLLGLPLLRRRLGLQASASLKKYYDSGKVVHFYGQLYIAAFQRKPIGQYPNMKETMWPVYNPFLPLSKTGE